MSVTTDKPMSTEVAMAKFVEFFISEFKLEQCSINKVEINSAKKQVRIWFFHEEFGRSGPLIYTFDDEVETV